MLDASGVRIGVRMLPESAGMVALETVEAGLTVKEAGELAGRTPGTVSRR